MNLVHPTICIPTSYDRKYGEAVLSNLEAFGRTCYKSDDKITQGSSKEFVKGLIARGHESVLEHSTITVRLICDRGVSHELVRHRVASYSQESTRYCNYSKDKFGAELTFIDPKYCNDFDYTDEQIEAIRQLYLASEKTYLGLLESGMTPELARCVLPNGLKTEVVMTANLREWRHILRLRCSKAAHPDIQMIMEGLLTLFTEFLPEVFGDIFDEVFNNG